MTRHGIEAEVLLASVASHPLGRFETLSPDEFQMLCRDMHGAFPDVVRRSLPGGIELGVARCLSKRAEIDLSTPEPNPVDYDWRFDEQTARLLADVIAQGAYREVLCVGAPTAYGAIRARGGAAFLIDHNPLLARILSTGSFLIREVSVEEELAPHIDRRFDAAVVDPPWYPEAYDLWLSRTVPLLRAGADLFLVVFRRFTRPNAEQERTQLLRRLERIGRVSLEPFEAVYSTPPFEQEVLRRLQLPRLPSWRAADVFRVTVFSDPDLSVFDPIAWSVAKWNRFDLGDQVVAVQDVRGDNGPIQVRNELPTEVTSVSQRDPSRAQYTVWTSRSRAAVVKGTKRLAAILGNSSTTTIEQSDLQVANELSQKLLFQIRR